MKRIISAVALAAVTLSLSAQQVTDPAKIVVANVNAETITLAQLNAMYDGMNPELRAQYEKTGGKSAFLDNYIRKRLIVQEALKQGFDRRPEVSIAMRAAAEGALFDKYIRESLASSVVTDAMVRQFYEDHKADFTRPEQVKARHIIITFGENGPNAKKKEEAEAVIHRVSDALDAKLKNVTGGPDAKLAAAIHEFDAAARTYSEDGTASMGGDLGWFGKGVMDAAFEKVAFETEPGTISKPFQSAFGYHIILVEARRPAGPAPFEEMVSAIRDKLLNDNGAEIMKLVSTTSTTLRATGKVAVFPENIK